MRKFVGLINHTFKESTYSYTETTDSMTLIRRSSGHQQTLNWLLYSATKGAWTYPPPPHASQPHTHYQHKSVSQTLSFILPQTSPNVIWRHSWLTYTAGVTFITFGGLTIFWGKSKTHIYEPLVFACAYLRSLLFAFDSCVGPLKLYQLVYLLLVINPLTPTDFFYPRLLPGPMQTSIDS